MLNARRLAIIVTLKCTLNCKLCCNCVTMYDNPPLIDKESIFHDLKAVFGIYDRIEWLQFVGGELFLHPEMGEILSESFKYTDQFDRIILMTNGTLVPDDSVLEVMAAHKDKIEVQISDYGPLSFSIKELVAELEKRNIPHVVKCFYGDMQHYGGWVDSGDFESRNYSPQALEAVFTQCWQIGMQNLHAYNGQLHNCIRSLFATDLGKITPGEEDYIDLRDETLSLDAKREIASKFNTKPLAACMVCNGFDSKNSIRYPAAEQI